MLSNLVFSREGAEDGVVLALMTLSATLVFELYSLEAVQKIWQQPNGKSLYWQAVSKNVFNHLLLGVLVYSFAVGTLVSKDPVVSYWEGALQVIWVLVIHGYEYYTVHKAMHEIPALYQFHRFHHLFNTNVAPSTANAVTVGEYTMAYVIPFLPPLMLRSTARGPLFIAVCIISFTNILIHTPKLEEMSKKWTPSFWVSTNNHLEHHRKSNCHYAASTFNFDYLSSLVFGGNSNVKPSSA